MDPLPWVCPCGLLPYYYNPINPRAIMPLSSHDIHKVHGWTFMKKLGYTLGKGLRKNKDGKVEPYTPPPCAVKKGLGYDRNNHQPQNKQWTLKEHFVSCSIFNPNESPDLDDPFQCVNFDYDADSDDENQWKSFSTPSRRSSMASSERFSSSKSAL